MKIADRYANFLVCMVNPLFWLPVVFGLFFVLLSIATFPFWGWLLLSGKYRESFVKLFRRSINDRT